MLFFKKILRITLPLLNACGWFALCIMNTLAALGKINNRTPEDITGMYICTEFVPDAIAFIVMWSSIFIFFGIFVIYQLLPQNWNHHMVKNQIGYLWFFGYAVPQVVWFFLWHHGHVWTSVLNQFFIFLVSLALYIRVGCDYSIYGRNRIIDSKSGTRLTTFETWFLQIPFSILFAWLFLSILANTAVAVASQQSPSSNAELSYYNEQWTSESILLQIMSNVGAITLLVVRNDIFFGLSVLWGFITISWAHPFNQRVYISAISNAIVLGLSITITILYMVMQVYMPNAFTTAKSITNRHEKKD